MTVANKRLSCLRTRYTRRMIRRWRIGVLLSASSGSDVTTRPAVMASSDMAWHGVAKKQACGDMTARQESEEEAAAARVILLPHCTHTGLWDGITCQLRVAACAHGAATPCARAVRWTWPAGNSEELSHGSDLYQRQ